MNRSSGTCRTISSSGRRRPFGRRSRHLRVRHRHRVPGELRRDHVPAHADQALRELRQHHRLRDQQRAGLPHPLGDLVERDVERFHGKLGRHAIPGDAHGGLVGLGSGGGQRSTGGRLPILRRLGRDGHAARSAGAGRAAGSPRARPDPPPRAGSRRAPRRLQRRRRPDRRGRCDPGSGRLAGAASLDAPDSVHRMERHRDPVEPVDLDLRRIRGEQLLRELADHLVDGKPQAVSQVLGDLGLAQSHQVGRELIGDIAPRDPRHPFRELGDHELAGDPEESGIAEARRHLVLRREERAGRELVHDAVERDPQHHFRSAGRAGRLGFAPALRGRGAAPTGLLVRCRRGRGRRRRRDRHRPERPSRRAREPARLARAAPSLREPVASSAGALCTRAGVAPRARRLADERAAGGGPLAGKAGGRVQQVTERHQEQHHADAAPARAAAASRAGRAPRAPDRATR